MHGTGWELGLEEGTPRGPGRGSPRQYLALHQHGHVHKHVMQLTDAGFQFDDLIVPRLDFVQRLLCHLRVHFDLG